MVAEPESGPLATKKLYLSCSVDARLSQVSNTFKGLGSLLRIETFLLGRTIKFTMLEDIEEVRKLVRDAVEGKFVAPVLYPPAINFVNKLCAVSIENVKTFDQPVGGDKLLFIELKAKMEADKNVALAKAGFRKPRAHELGLEAAFYLFDYLESEVEPKLEIPE